MSASMVRHLISKDLYLLRPMMIGALLFGGIGIALLPLGETPFFVGWLLLFIVTVLLAIFTTAVGVITERKERVHLFVLTMPTSPAQYTTAKLAANSLAFLVPWTILLAAALTVVAVTPIPDRLMPFLAALLLYSVCYYAAYLAVALVTDSVIFSTLVIIIGNTIPAFLIPALFRLPGVSADPVAAGPIWTAEVLTVLASEIVFSAAALGLGVYVRSRQEDLI
jgi:hypothetical protein